MRYSLGAFILLLALPCKSQTSLYRPFPTDAGNWVYRYYDDFGAPTMFYTHNEVAGDTTIATVTYKKIFQNSVYKGGLRENAKVVYILPDTSMVEYVLYDFNLELGDSITNLYGGVLDACSDDTITVVYVDSVLATDGYHRQLHLSAGVYWIEGIGSTSYLLRPAIVACLSGDDVLQCMVSDTNFNYPGNFSNCNVGEEEENEIVFSVNVYPNPGNGVFTLTSTETVMFYELYNATGKLLYTRPVMTTSTEISISLPGIYLLTVVNTSGAKTFKRIVVH